jgi:aspartyl/asparaginyl-tRNA synthetase
MSTVNKEDSMKTKEEYIDSLATELKKWSAEIDVLQAKTEVASDDVKLKYREEIEVLRAKELVASEKIKELQASSGDAWESIKETADSVWHDLKTGVETVVSKFK